jgi:hypothetical protein
MEEYAGYHWFTTGEVACVTGQTATCVDEAICNSIAPYIEANGDGTAWNSNGFVCDYNDTYPEPTWCTYMMDMDTAEMPAILPYDIVCDQTQLPTVVIYTCNPAWEGGLNCTQFNPLTHTNIDEVALAWNITNTTEDVMMMVPVGSWWMDYESELTMECYDWLSATDPDSDRPYIFLIADYACDIGMVFECVDSQTCNTI